MDDKILALLTSMATAPRGLRCPRASICAFEMGTCLPLMLTSDKKLYT